MNDATLIRLELGINAQRFMQQVQIQNQLIEDQIQKGIDLAFNDIATDENFTEMIRKTVKDELYDIVRKKVLSWEIRNKISNAVESKLGAKIDDYADELSNKIASSFGNNNVISDKE